MAAKTIDMKPLALENTLRDLALLRASEVDLNALLPMANDIRAKDATVHSVDATVESSYELVREARKALKAQNGGERIEEVRNKLAEVQRGIL
jgi:hypothetical protein